MQKADWKYERFAKIENGVSKQWYVVTCYRKCFDGKLLELGFDNTNPGELLVDCESRIAKRFEVKVEDLELHILDR